MWGRRAGVNPLIHLGLIEGSADPEEVALIATIRDAREFADPSFMLDVVTPLAEGWLGLPVTSPAHILLDRLHRVGFAVTTTGQLRDPFGDFSLNINYNELLLRVQLAWHRQVASSVQHRADFQGLHWVDVVTTRRKIRSLNGSTQTLYRLGLAGGSFTADATCHWTSHGRDSCQWCGACDSLLHRYWQCPCTQHLRDHHAPSVAFCFGNLPAALTLRGWALHSPSWHQWLRLLASLPLTVLEPFTPWPQQSWVDVFTDGSCLWQAQPAFRVASWSAVIASPFVPDWAFQSHGVLGASVLPGLIQTAFRAELYAVAYCLHWASRSRVRVHLWSDCLGVVHHLLLLCHGKRRVRPNTSNADLWFWILESLDNLGYENMKITKVPAHRTVGSAKSRQQAWIFWNNGAADRAARMANVSRPARFWEVWSRHAAETLAIQNLFEEVVNLQLAVATFSMQTTQGQTEYFEGEQANKPRRSFLRFYDDSEWQQQLPPSLVERYNVNLVRKVSTWWQARVTSGENATLRWVPLVFLYIDYQMTWDCPGPLKIQGRWIEAKTRPHLAPERFEHRVRMRWFRNFLQSFWRSVGIKLTVATCKSDHELVQAHVPCVSVHWDEWCESKVAAWLQARLRGPCARDAHALRGLTLAKPDMAMSLLVPNTGT